MKKYSNLSKFALAVLMTGTAANCFAQDGSPIVIEEGEAFKPAINTVYEFTPQVEGTLTIHVAKYPDYNYYPTGTSALIFSSPALLDDEMIICSRFETPANEAWTDYIYNNMSAGESVYLFLTSNVYVGVDFTFSMQESEVYESVVDVDPAPDQIFDYVLSPEIKIFCSGNVTKIGETTFNYNDESVVLDPALYGVFPNGPLNSQFLQIGGVSFPAFRTLVAAAANSDAETFTITLKDVEANGIAVTKNETTLEGVDVTDGVISVTFKILPAAQYIPAESYWPETFYNSWPKGDKNGIAVMKFNQDIAKVSEVQLIMGHADYGSQSETVYTTYDLSNDVTIDGSEVKIDFTGVTRSASQKEVTVSISGIIGTNGMPADLSEFGVTSQLLFVYIPFVNSAYSGVATLEDVVNGEDLIYDLNGVKVNKSTVTPGVYVINGKKVLVK